MFYEIFILMVVLGFWVIIPDAKAQVTIGNQTCYNVWSLYDYYDNGTYAFSAWEADGVNCYDNGGGSGGQFWDQEEPRPLEDPPPPQDICTALRSAIPTDCNVASPPHVTVDSCTLVPDFLVVNGTPASSLGSIFTAACNNHDRCYQTLSSNKQLCDIRLEQDMIQSAMEAIPSVQWAYYEPHVRTQAAAYAVGLYNNVFWIPQAVFNSRQNDAACRSISQALIQSNCST